MDAQSGKVLRRQARNRASEARVAAANQKAVDRRKRRQTSKEERKLTEDEVIALRKLQARQVRNIVRIRKRELKHEQYARDGINGGAHFIARRLTRETKTRMSAAG